MTKKNVLITGAGRRLGFFLTEAFLLAGWHVITFTRQNQTEEFSAIKSDSLTTIELGAYSQVELEKALRYVGTHFSRLDAVIHNASIYEPDEAHNHDVSSFYEMLFNIHMRVPAQINLAVKGLLYDENSPGNIIHITDIYAENPNPEYAFYCSTKAGLESLSKSFAKKYAPGIRVNSIQPGPIKFLSEHTHDHKQQVMNETLLSGEGGFLPIYKAVKSLLDNDFITGTHIRVDGGRALKRG